MTHMYECKECGCPERLTEEEAEGPEEGRAACKECFGWQWERIPDGTPCKTVRSVDEINDLDPVVEEAEVND